MAKEYRIKSEVISGNLCWLAESRGTSIFSKIFAWEFVDGSLELTRQKCVSTLAFILKSENGTLYFNSDGTPKGNAA